MVSANCKSHERIAMDLCAINQTSASPRFGIAFGGGGARGFAHINVIQAFDELGLRPSIIAGTSIGSIIGASYAAGMSGRELKEFAAESVSSRRSLYARFWSTRSGNLWDLVSKGPQAVQFNIEKLLQGFLPDLLPDTFEELKMPFTAIATDFYNQQDHAMSSGHLLSALAASSCIPAIFSPVIRDKSTLIDGATTNPVPFEYLSGKADILVGVDIIATTNALRPMKSTIEASYGASQILQKTIIDLKTAIFKPDLIIRPDISRFKTMEFMRAKQIIEATAYIKEETKRNIDKLIATRDLNQKIDRRQEA